MVALEAELAEETVAYARLIDISARFKVNGNMARADLAGSKLRLGKVDQQAKLASDRLDETRKQSLETAKAAAEALRQLTEVSG